MCTARRSPSSPGRAAPGLRRRTPRRERPCPTPTATRCPEALRDGANPICADRRLASLDQRRRDPLSVGLLVQRVVGRLTQHRLPTFAPLLKALSQVDGVTDEGILQPLFRV